MPDRGWDVIGVLSGAELGPGYTTSPATVAIAAMPEVRSSDGTGDLFRVGPAVLLLAGGERLTVPPSTPGANASLHLLTHENRVAATGNPALALSDDEVRRASPGMLHRQVAVVASLADGGVVSRFALLRLEDRGLAEAGSPLELTDELVTTSLGYTFALAPHRSISSWLEGDGWRRAPSEVLVDPTSGLAVEIAGLLVD